MRFLLAAAALFILLFSCRKTNEPRNLSILLEQCSSTVYNGDSIRVCFDSLSDSRCPANANCIWQGIATGTFNVRINQQSHHIKLSTPELQPGFSKDTTLGIYHFTLTGVMPYPGTGSVVPEAMISISN